MKIVTCRVQSKVLAKGALFLCRPSIKWIWFKIIRKMKARKTTFDKFCLKWQNSYLLQLLQCIMQCHMCSRFLWTSTRSRWRRRSSRIGISQRRGTTSPSRSQCTRVALCLAAGKLQWSSTMGLSCCLQMHGRRRRRRAKKHSRIKSELWWLQRNYQADDKEQNSNAQGILLRMGVY